MLIAVHVPWDIQTLLRLADVLVQASATAMLRSGALVQIPLLYESGVIYQREAIETWRSAHETLAHGWEDCDSLAIWRAAELRVRGWEALAPHHPGAARARKLDLRQIPAQVFFSQRLPDGVEPTGGPGAYHVVLRYQVDGRWHADDPSARLGMRRGTSPSGVRTHLVEPYVWSRWEALGVRSRVVAHWRDRGVHLTPDESATPEALALELES